MAKKENYQKFHTTPFETGIRNFSHIAKFFLYYAPNIDSSHSLGKIKDDSADQILLKMKNHAGISQTSKFVKKIGPDTWNANGFNSDELAFDVPGLTCECHAKENQLSALLRHIRNAFAHGNIYVKRTKKGNYIFLVDWDKNKKKITAKIMVSMAILEDWKAILENVVF